MKNNIQRFFRDIKRLAIATLLFPALSLLFSFTPKHIWKTSLQMVRKEVITKGTFQSIIINGDISVILTNEPAGTVVIEGNEKDVDNIIYRNKNNELVVDAGRKRRFAKLTIYLSAGMLKHMLVNGDGNVSSTGIIKTDDLHIWLKGNINVEIDVKGKVSVDSCDDYDLFGNPLIKT